MNEVQTPRRYRSWAFIFLTLAVAAHLGFGGISKWQGTLLFQDISFDGRYRLETWQAFSPGSIDYGFYRLYDNRSGRLLCESGVQWRTRMRPGEVGWPSDTYPVVDASINVILVMSDDGATCREHIVLSE